MRGALGMMSRRHICALLSGLHFLLSFICFPIALIQQMLIFTGRTHPAYRIEAHGRCWWYVVLRSTGKATHIGLKSHLNIS